MNPNNYTSQSSVIIQQAMQIAQERGQQAIETGHLLQAILQDDTQTASFLLKKLGVNPSQIQTVLAPILNTYPKVSGDQAYASNALQPALQRAERGGFVFIPIGWKRFRGRCLEKARINNKEF